VAQYSTYTGEPVDIPSGSHPVDTTGAPTLQANRLTYIGDMVVGNVAFLPPFAMYVGDPLVLYNEFPCAYSSYITEGSGSTSLATCNGSETIPITSGPVIGDAVPNMHYFNLGFLFDESFAVPTFPGGSGPYPIGYDLGIRQYAAITTVVSPGTLVGGNQWYITIPQQAFTIDPTVSVTPSTQTWGLVPYKFAIYANLYLADFSAGLTVPPTLSILQTLTPSTLTGVPSPYTGVITLSGQTTTIDNTTAPHDQGIITTQATFNIVYPTTSYSFNRSNLPSQFAVWFGINASIGTAHITTGGGYPNAGTYVPIQINYGALNIPLSPITTMTTLYPTNGTNPGFDFFFYQAP
jgi:hypothetical protein